ncbi:hypothetical protein [Myroides odoratimimus]|uniref:hypothetical protein n=1 Tax=Myroides odoratimimus TaxID=76832 RepID=UPI003100B673
MSTQYNTQEILKASIENIGALKHHLEEIDTLKSNVKEVILEAEKVPILFNKLAIDIDKSTNNYLNKNQDLLKEQIIFFQEKLIDLTMRINQIDEIDFTKKFEYSKDEFFKQLNNSTQELDNLILDLKGIDLEQHFTRHEKTLSDIYKSINIISASLVTFTDQLNKSQNKLNEIERELLQTQTKINSLEVKVDKMHTTFLDNNTLLNNKIDYLTKANKQSHIINLVLILIVLICVIIFNLI